MQLYPAIDMKGGKCVRLTQGLFDNVKVYSDTPADMAKLWVSQGASFLFTIAPNKAYMIRNGKLAEPVRISVVTGSVMHTLHEIDGLTKDVKVCSLSTGGCGKMEQWPLRVAFGGPYVRVRNIQVQ